MPKYSYLEETKPQFKMTVNQLVEFIAKIMNLDFFYITNQDKDEFYSFDIEKQYEIITEFLENEVDMEYKNINDAQYDKFLDFLEDGNYHSFDDYPPHEQLDVILDFLRHADDDDSDDDSDNGSDDDSDGEEIDEGETQMSSCLDFSISYPDLVANGPIHNPYISAKAAKYFYPEA